MYSSMGEYVKFVNEVDPINRETGDVKNVEDWLTDVESRMRDSLRDLIKRGTAAYSSSGRNKWVFDWPQQIVLTLEQVLWTHEIEEGAIL